MKLVISDPKSGRAYQHETDKTSSLVGVKIGSEIDGKDIGLSGFKFEVMGGSDSDGFPMRKDVHGAGRKSVLLSSGSGFKSTQKGIRRRKQVRGDTVSDVIIQLNLKITKSGSKPLEEVLKG